MKKKSNSEGPVSRCHAKTKERMRARASLPVSRDLVRIVKESSRLEGGPHSLNDHLHAVDARQAQSVEFYLRACALRLERGL
jgi:hypothetical protein